MSSRRRGRPPLVVEVRVRIPAELRRRALVLASALGLVDGARRPILAALVRRLLEEAATPRGGARGTMKDTDTGGNDE